MLVYVSDGLAVSSEEIVGASKIVVLNMTVMLDFFLTTQT
jgi:hypothetical protein